MQPSLPILAAAVLLAGCANERPTTFGSQINDQAREIRRLGEQWEEGARKIARGNELIVEGQRMVARGEEMIVAGQEEKRQSEAAYQALGLPPPQPPQAPE